MTTPTAPAVRSDGGTLYALSAYLMWGLAPVYFHAVGFAPALEILAHRVVWSVVLLFPAVLLIKGARRGWSLVGSWRRLPVFTASTLLVSGNWLLYIWAVNHGHIVESSLGYFINPLVNVLLGVVFLRERLTRLQILSVVLAGIGVVSLLISQGRPPWISMGLALSFGLYGLVRKKAAFDPLVGLLVETLLLFPAALALLGWLGVRGVGSLGSAGVGRDLLLAFSGIMTAVPLVLFLMGAERLKLTTLGLLQYVAPSVQLAVGLFVFHESFPAAYAVAFAFIWTGLAVYTAEFLFLRRPPPGDPVDAAEP